MRVAQSAVVGCTAGAAWKAAAAEAKQTAIDARIIRATAESTAASLSAPCVLYCVLYCFVDASVFASVLQAASCRLLAVLAELQKEQAFRNADKPTSRRRV